MWARTAAAVAAAVLLGTVAPAPAHAAPESAACTGVVVVVEGQGQGCATHHATGQEALRSAGFATQDQSPGMLCRINEQPATCAVRPGAYWSYWQSTPTGDGYTPWVYAQLGYTASQPKPGDVEGWVFGDGSRPPSVPPAQAAGSPAPVSAGTSGAAPGAQPGPDVTGVVVTGVIVLAGAAGIAYVLVRRRRP